VKLFAARLDRRMPESIRFRGWASHERVPVAVPEEVLHCFQPPTSGWAASARARVGGPKTFVPAGSGHLQPGLRWDTMTPLPVDAPTLLVWGNGVRPAQRGRSTPSSSFCRSSTLSLKRPVRMMRAKLLSSP